MASYWIVVPRGNAELFELLSMAFDGRSGFNVIMDRRGAPAADPGVDRRARGEELGPDEIVVAERAEQAEQAAVGSDERVTAALPRVRRPVVRRIPKRAESGARLSRLGAPLPARTRQRLFSL